MESIWSIRVGGRTPHRDAEPTPELDADRCTDIDHHQHSEHHANMDCQPVAAADAHAASISNRQPNHPGDGHADQHGNASAAAQFDATAFKHTIEGPEPYAVVNPHPDVYAYAAPFHPRGYKHATPKRDTGALKHAAS
jgi:hypothetical protein